MEPYETKRNIASAWCLLIQESHTSPLSLSLTQKKDSSILFRDFFVHLNLSKMTFELPAPEVWVPNTSAIDRLTEVLTSDISNIRELIDFERGLRFAVLKIKDLIMTKFEYLANPYYLQSASAADLPPTNDIADEIYRLTEELSSIDGKSHSKLHEKVLKSFGNVKLRWEQVHESGTLQLHKVDAKRFGREIADRHFGFVGNP